MQWNRSFKVLLPFLYPGSLLFLGICHLAARTEIWRMEKWIAGSFRPITDIVMQDSHPSEMFL